VGLVVEASTLPSPEQLRERAGDDKEFRRLMFRHGYAVPDRRCPAGRPLYVQGELPDRLATRTMLHQVHGRRPGRDQEPVASYYTALGGRRYHPLYEVAAAERLPSRGRCPVCGMARQVLGTGRVRRHLGQAPASADAADRPVCPGSGAEPVDERQEVGRG
jgi:hypothetical protein